MVDEELIVLGEHIDIVNSLVDSWVNGNKSYVIGEIEKMSVLDAASISGAMVALLIDMETLSSMSSEPLPFIEGLRIKNESNKDKFNKNRNTQIMTKPLHPSTEHVLKFFRYEHLPENLKEVSRPFAELAKTVALKSESPETTVALRKLLESKDAAVRAALS